jgi:thermitase
LRTHILQRFFAALIKQSLEKDYTMETTPFRQSPTILKHVWSIKQFTTLKQIVAMTLATGLIGLHASSTHAAPPADSSLQSWAKGRILIEPRAGLPVGELDKLLSPYGGKRHKLGQSNLYIVDLPANVSEVAVIEKLAHNPHLKFAELDRRVKTSFVPNDPYLGSEWHLNTVGAQSAWDTTQGAGITIAILDSGVDPSHPDLVSNLIPGYNVYDNNTNTADVCGHGTAVAGTAAASSNNSTGVAGIAGQSKIMPVRIAYYDATQGCYAFYSTVANGLTYAADHGARIANVSYGGVAASSTVQSAAHYLQGKNGLLFVSAGNNGINENITPTNTMIPVSATDSNDTMTSWSSYGSFVEMSAPGLYLWTTSNGGTYGQWSGTSFSSPLTAGVAALMMSANPALSGSQIESIMTSTATDLGAAGRDIYYGYGRVNAAAAVQAAANATATIDTQAPTASITAPLANATVSGLVTVNVTATDNVGVARVELQVNGSTVAIDNTSPFGFSWDSTGVLNGMSTLVVAAYDAAGNSGTSAPISVNVANNATPIAADTTPPVVTITNPVAGYVSGTVSVTVNATDDSSASGISQTLYIDGVKKAHVTGGSLAYNWNTRKVTAGLHTIQAVAADAAGNSSSTSVQVTK